MIRPAQILLLAAGLALAALPVSAQVADAPRPAHKAAKPRKGLPARAAPVAGGINTPSTDFSKIERADEEPSGPNWPSVRPTMGSGGMGMGASF